MQSRLKQLVLLLLVWPVGLVMPAGLIMSAGAAVDDSSGKAAARFKASEIRELIAQLGDEQYLQRQLAETQLLQLGAEVFAELQAAENHTDLEIVTRAKYILSQIRIEWVRPTDPAAVRSIMNRYGELSQTLRLAKVAQLSRLENEQGFGALCRIARYDSSSKVVRYAALSILESGFLPAKRASKAVAVLAAELGESDQVPLSWISVYVNQLQAPKSMDPRWLPLIDAETERLAEDTGETELPLVVSLLRCHLELCNELSDAKAIWASLMRRIELLANRDSMSQLSFEMALAKELIGALEWEMLKMRGDSRTLGQLDAMAWLIDHEQWEAMELLEDHYANSIRDQRRLIYLIAVAREKQGRAEEAAQIVEQALQVEAVAPEEHNQIAERIAEFGHHDWAEREWSHVIETLPATDLQSLLARNSMSLYRLNDRGEHQAAANLLDESIKAIREDPAAREQYKNAGRFLRSVSANREFYLACHYETLADFEKQRRHLDQAIRLAPKNADVLIAMYRLQEASDTYRKATAGRIAKVQKQMENEIKQNPKDAQSYNQWAWLVSNTEGDFAKAVERSQLSLKLTPGSPSYMDTLGRCYYSAGDLESAVKIQREAVAKHPHMMVMQRQLKFFESELLQKRARDSADN